MWISLSPCGLALVPPFSSRPHQAARVHHRAFGGFRYFGPGRQRGTTHSLPPKLERTNTKRVATGTWALALPSRPVQPYWRRVSATLDEAASALPTAEKGAAIMGRAPCRLAIK